MRLIDADALRKEVRELPNEATDCSYLDLVDREVVQALISEAPTVEGRPHGKWEFIGENLFKCTNCGYIADADYLRKWKVHTYDAEFPTACLKCGASMSANDKQVTGKLNSEIENSKSEIVPDYRDGWRLKEGDGNGVSKPCNE